MIRIKTVFESDRSYVRTVQYNDRWYTYGYLDGLMYSRYESLDLLEAGGNHLIAALSLREKLLEDSSTKK